MATYFGIDFGTTSSATVGYMVMDHTPEEFLYGDEEGRPIPSVVAIDKKTGEVFTGQATCAPDDKFDLALGVEVAEKRAIRKMVTTSLDDELNALTI